jgi:hypothetical protein
MNIDCVGESSSNQDQLGIDLRTDRNDVVPYPQFRYGSGITTYRRHCVSPAPPTTTDTIHRTSNNQPAAGRDHGVRRNGPSYRSRTGVSVNNDGTTIRMTIGLEGWMMVRVARRRRRRRRFQFVEADDE